MRIAIDGGHLNLIGDALCSLPYLRALVEREEAEGIAFHNGFSQAVRPLLADWGWTWEHTPPPSDVKVRPMPLDQVFNHCNGVDRNLHMAQGWFAINNLPVPLMPITLPFSVGEVTATDYVLIAPFSRSDYNGNKLWPHERWVELTAKLNKPVMIVGSAIDNWTPYEGKGATFIVDRSLPDVLGMLRSCSLFLSIDNGISHLAHFGGVAQHLLLEPSCLSPVFVHNPRGKSIREHPFNITVEAMESLAGKFLCK